MEHYDGSTAAALWMLLLRHLRERGTLTLPRGIACFELQDVVLHLKHARQNIIEHPARKLSYQFMVAEWLWILFGHDDVATIAQYNRNIAAFSDDGVTFNGTYGLPVQKHWKRVRDLLKKDWSTRQAVIPIFGEQKSYESKDIPCTVSMQFLIRGERLNTTVTMRSSDVYLGIPYDIYNFTMLANTMAAELGISLGSLTLQLASSHLYEKDVEQVDKIIHEHEALRYHASPRLPFFPPKQLDEVLKTRSILDSLPRPFDTYAQVLIAKNYEKALKELTSIS